MNFRVFVATEEASSFTVYGNAAILPFNSAARNRRIIKRVAHADSEGIR